MAHMLCILDKCHIGLLKRTKQLSAHKGSDSVLVPFNHLNFVQVFIIINHRLRSKFLTLFLFWVLSMDSRRNVIYIRKYSVTMLFGKTVQTVI